MMNSWFPLDEMMGKGKTTDPVLVPVCIYPLIYGETGKTPLMENSIIQ